jgi:hypothetical protein
MYEKLTALTGAERVRAIEHNLDVAHFTYGPKVSASHVLPDWYRKVGDKLLKLWTPSNGLH